jgi:hypothetical protein
MPAKSIFCVIGEKITFLFFRGGRRKDPEPQKGSILYFRVVLSDLFGVFTDFPDDLIQFFG